MNKKTLKFKNLSEIGEWDAHVGDNGAISAVESSERLTYKEDLQEALKEFKFVGGQSVKIEVSKYCLDNMGIHQFGDFIAVLREIGDIKITKAEMFLNKNLKKKDLMTITFISFD